MVFTQNESKYCTIKESQSTNRSASTGRCARQQQIPLPLRFVVGAGSLLFFDAFTIALIVQSCAKAKAIEVKKNYKSDMASFDPTLYMFIADVVVRMNMEQFLEYVYCKSTICGSEWMQRFSSYLKGVRLDLQKSPNTAPELNEKMKNMCMMCDLYVNR